MKRIYWIGLLSLFIVACGTKDYEKTDLGLKTTIDSTTVDIQFFSPKIVRILKYPQDSVIDKKSLSVVKTPEKMDLNISEDENHFTISSNSLSVKLNRKSGEIAYSDLNGNSLFTEASPGYDFTPTNDAGESTFKVSQSFQLETDEAIYGLGILQQGKMSQRNQEVYMVQGNTQDYVPFFQSVKGYGLFWDNYAPTTFKDGSDGTQFSSDVGTCIDYYFMLGGNADGVIAEMRDLTGQAPMFPLWTFGFWQSKERYKSQEETVGIVEKYRELEVPLDGIIQDWQYWGDNYHWNAMEFLNPQFSNPQKFVDDVHNLNAHMIISIWSSFGPETKEYKELKDKDMLMDFATWPLSGKDVWPPDMDYPSGVVVYDPYNPEARDIYWKYLNNGLFSLGMDGWWMDSTEPDHMNAKPEDLDNKTYLGSFRKVRNAFPLMTVGGVYDHQREVTSDKRVFILTRSAFAGQQRYGANTWTGDVTSSWEALKNQIPAGLNFSMTGIPYWNTDIGGFFLTKFPKKLEDPDYKELYARWVQFGTFSTMMRSHGADAPREIYQFGKKGDAIYDAIEKFIHLRYSLLPYIYSASHDVTANQSSMTRALVMDFTSDQNTHDINNQYMFGKSILVAPVTDPMYTKDVVTGNSNNNIQDFSTVKSTEVYLPTNTAWYDFWTNEKHEGGKTITKETPIDIMPLYVKAGSVIPFGPKVQYAEEKDWSNLEIRVYQGANGEFNLYEDENDNYNYEKGVYSIIKFRWDDTNKKLTIDKREGSFDGMLENRSFNIVIINAQNEPISKTIDYKGEMLELQL
ncbi:glycoside hydrolase family 31 protein [Confluentibacter flavum]|uniref:Xylosidase n=1 Tax=Confluentibacter flavum TaxID=1909700 RepID=A0A2N3HJQ3_9FLAO|nr:glycoside hydrolase family 31 protein [Confluentibacter flavum]PKQ45153.1 xylosidase [Confluentibacter flavum]